MANAITGGTHERQERYAKLANKIISAKTVIRSLFNRNYEDNPISGAVKIPSRTLLPVVGDYNIGTGIPITQATTTYITLPINTSKAINEIIDGYEAQAVPDNIVLDRLESGVQALAITLERDTVTTLLNQGTIDADITPSTRGNIYETIVNKIEVLQIIGIDVSELVIAIHPSTYTMLLTDEKFSNTSGVLGAELIRTGIVGKIAGVPVYTSLYLPAITEFLIFAPTWACAVDEWKVPFKLENLTNQYIGASALTARIVYGQIITNPVTVLIKNKA